MMLYPIKWYNWLQTEHPVILWKTATDTWGCSLDQ